MAHRYRHSSSQLKPFGLEETAARTQVLNEHSSAIVGATPIACHAARSNGRGGNCEKKQAELFVFLGMVGDTADDAACCCSSNQGG